MKAAITIGVEKDVATGKYSVRMDVSDGSIYEHCDISTPEEANAIVEAWQALVEKCMAGMICSVTRSLRVTV